MADGYIELHAHSYFSLLDGSSAPEVLVARALALGMPALALTDHNGLYGAVRFWTAAREQGLQAIIGAEVTLEDEHHLTLLAENARGYANLCKLITAAHLRPVEGDAWPGKTPPRLAWDILAAHPQGLIALTGCRAGPVAAPLLEGRTEEAHRAAGRLRDIFGPQSLFVELQRHLLPDEPPLIRALVDLARVLAVPVVATNDVHYAARDGHRLQDVLVSIRTLTSLDEAQARGLLRPNSEYHLKASGDMARLFAGLPEAITATQAIAERCHVSLDFGGQRLPAFPVPEGQTAFSLLYDFCQQGLHRKYDPVTPRASLQLARELDVIERTGLAGYFLVVWDIVRFARESGIRYQGRGSAANSLVAYLLDITPVDPLRFNLLFERFLSDDRRTMPDIDIDFAADRRDEVIQYVYTRYGVEHTAMVCNVNTFQERSAARDITRSLDLTPHPSPPGPLAPLLTEGETSLAENAFSPGEGREGVGQWSEALVDVPRHLSIHVGGMLITAGPLDEIVPLERATMPGRVVTQWDKDSVEDAGLIKLDLLALRTLGMVAEVCRLTPGALPGPDAQAPSRPRLSAVRADGNESTPDALDDPAVYDMLCRGDTLGAFQVESRAQMQMLPRLRPRCFEDIVVAVSIIRPGPIQGNMVHPYLRRRAGEETVTYVHPSLEPILGETLGVILFQEQVLRVAMAVAGFTGGEADSLRRALSRDWPPERMAPLRARFLAGAQARGIEESVAAETFAQLTAFAGYGFCKSHAAAFAGLAYETLWLKLYYPAEFYCALLNHQPMGFYTPSVVMGDALRHDVPVLVPDINHSAEACTVDRPAGGARRPGVRLGLRYVKGFGPGACARLLAARASGPFKDLVDLCRRTHLPRGLVENLIRSGAFDELAGDPQQARAGERERRPLLWQLGALDYREEALPLDSAVEPAELPELSEAEAIIWEHELLGMAPGDHPMRLYRERLSAAGILSSTGLARRTDRSFVRVAGQVVVRQRPPTAKGHVFLTLEDEQGLMNIIVRPDVHARYEDILARNALIIVTGHLQRVGETHSIIAQEIRALTP